MNEIFLDFINRDYSDADVCSDEALINKEQMEHALKIWDNLYNDILVKKSNIDGISFKQYHNTISILADRGAGKTTFILTFLQKIKKRSEVLCLDLMDPSLIESKQHPFISIIANINEIVEFEFNKLKSSDSFTPYGKGFDNFNRYKESYKELLKGLPFVDGIGKESVYEDWEDEEFISIKGMDKAKASNKLEASFHRYINCALLLLKKKCLVVPFDDIDTDFRKGFEILEVIRKYLTSYNIIPIITGDLELYCNLVRKAYWGLFTDDYLKKEIDYSNREKDEFSTIVDQLENQYLIKILKPENRIALKSIKDLMENNDFKIMVNVKGKGVQTLYKCYREIITNLGYGARNYLVSEELIKYLEGLSLRVQIRVLTEWNTYGDKDNNLLNTNVNSDSFSFANKLFGNFWNDVSQNSKNAKELMNSDSCYTLEMLRFLLYTDSLFYGSNFMPETTNKSLNKALFVVGSRFINLTNSNKSLIFDYIVRIIYVSKILEKIGAKNDEKLFKQFFKFTQFDIHTDLINSIGHANAFYNRQQNRITNESLDVLPGNIFIGNESPISFTDIGHIFSLLPMIGVMNNNKVESIFFSFQKLLASISELLAVDDDSFTLKLNVLSQYHYYLEPNDDFGRQESIYNDTNYMNWDNEIVHNDNDEMLFHEFKYKFDIWKESNFRIYPLLLSRIFNRTYNTIIYLDEKKKFSNLAEKWQMYIISFLNSVIVENALDRKVSDININTIGDIEEIFLSNIEKFKKSTVSLPLYNWLAACPLLTIYLDDFWFNVLTNNHIRPNYRLLDLLKYKKDKVLYEELGLKIKEKSDELAKKLKLKTILSYNLKLHDLRKRKALLEDVINVKDNTNIAPSLISDFLKKIDEVNKEIESIQNMRLVPDFMVSYDNIYDLNIEQIIHLNDENDYKIIKLNKEKNILNNDLNIVKTRVEDNDKFFKNIDVVFTKSNNNISVFSILKNIQLK